MPDLGDEEEFSELTAAQFSRVDLVQAPANGATSFLIMKQAEDTAGLLEPGFVRDLIAKAGPEQPESGRQEQVTVSGSPGAIAKMIHDAAQGAAGGVAKAAESTKSQNDLPDSDFAYIEPGGKKDADGKTVPRSLRHFPVNDAAHVRNALARASQSPFGDKAMPKIRAAAKKFGIDVAKEAGVDAVSKDMGPDLDDGADGMDPTVPLAEPDEMGPGDPTDPGSPAWESIDAATACKWTSILARARAALDLLSDREMMEAASADPDDAGNACDLQDACCAIDYVISILAPYAVAEQSEADTGAMGLEAIGKAMAGFGAVPLDRLETLALVRKAGRVLSSANEAEIRSAAASLQKVLTSLPMAPDAGAQVTKEAAMAATDKTGQDAPVVKTATPEAQAAAAGPVNAGGTTGLGQPRAAGPDAASPADGPQEALPGDLPGRQVVKGAIAAVFDHHGHLIGVADPAAIVQRVAKADGDSKPPMQAVFDQRGNLIGIVDPSAITPVAGADGGTKDAADDGSKDDAPAEPAADAPAEPPADDSDMTPAPPADAGIPADDVAKAAGGDITIAQDVLKSTVADAVTQALEAQGAAHQEAIAKMAAGKDELAEELQVLKARLETVENSPAAPKVFTNGQVPPAAQLRGQDAGAQPVDVAKALERKKALYGAADATEQNRVAKEMQGDAIAALTAVHARR